MRILVPSRIYSGCNDRAFSVAPRGILTAVAIMKFSMACWPVEVFTRRHVLSGLLASVAGCGVVGSLCVFFFGARLAGTSRT